MSIDFRLSCVYAEQKKPDLPLFIFLLKYHSNQIPFVIYAFL